jgi:hypothetical protein
MTNRPSLERSTEALNWLPECCEPSLANMSFLLTCIPKAKVAAVQSTRRPADGQLGISSNRYSPLLQEYSMLFCCEQAFPSAVDAFERVFRHRLSTDTLEKISQRMGAAADEFLHKRVAPPMSEEGGQDGCAARIFTALPVSNSISTCRVPASPGSPQATDA